MTEQSFDQHEEEIRQIENALDSAQNIPMPGNAEAFNEEMQKRMDEVDDNDDVVSDCCGASPECNGDCDSTDFGICPCCHDHCEFIKTTD